MPLFPFVLGIHVALAIGLFLPSLLLPFALRTNRSLETSRGTVVRGLLALQGPGSVVVGGGVALTGVLLVASLGVGLLGAGEVLGVDPDAIAVEAATANARRNGLASVINVRRGSVPTGEPPFDVILANLIASLLVTLAPALRDEMRPGGVLLDSGIFIDRESDVRTAFEAVGLAVTTRSAEGEWVALMATRPGVS